MQGAHQLVHLVRTGSDHSASKLRYRFPKSIVDTQDAVDEDDRPDVRLNLGHRGQVRCQELGHCQRARTWETRRSVCVSPDGSSGVALHLKLTER